jgi:hypothetical protein
VARSDSVRPPECNLRHREAYTERRDWPRLRNAIELSVGTMAYRQQMQAERGAVWAAQHSLSPTAVADANTHSQRRMRLDECSRRTVSVLCGARCKLKGAQCGKKTEKSDLIARETLVKWRLVRPQFDHPRRVLREYLPTQGHICLCTPGHTPVCPVRPIHAEPAAP